MVTENCCVAGGVERRAFGVDGHVNGRHREGHRLLAHWFREARWGGGSGGMTLVAVMVKLPGVGPAVKSPVCGIG